MQLEHLVGGGIDGALHPFERRIEKVLFPLVFPGLVQVQAGLIGHALDVGSAGGFVGGAVGRFQMRRAFAELIGNAPARGGEQPGLEVYSCELIRGN